MSKHFTLEEMVASTTAYNLKIDNTPTQEAIVNMTLLIDNTLQPIRDLWGKPVFVSSGYRCHQLNRVVGGSK